MNPLKRQVTDFYFYHQLQGWELLRKQHHELPAQAVTVLFYVASRGICHKQAIEEDIGLSTAACSRSIDILAIKSSRPGIKTPGLGLIRKFFDPSNGRRLLLELTPEGEKLMDQYKAMIG